MNVRRTFFLGLSLCLAGCIGALSIAPVRAAVPFEGFLPLVGVALTDEFEDGSDPFSSGTFFIAQPSDQPGGDFLGPGNSPYFDMALLDTGAATHIFTSTATDGFDIVGEGFEGSNTQLVGGATGLISLDINKPLGVYAAGLADRTSSNSPFTMGTSGMRGQTSFATLSAPPEWTLPSIIGLPMAAQHAVRISSSQPQIFSHDGRTVRTPNIELSELGSGGQDIIRRLPMKVKPGISFVTGPLYAFTVDFNLDFTPTSPSVVESGGLFVDVDITNGPAALNDTEFLYDTGASLTVVSEQTAVRLGFDPILDTPDFVLQVEGSGGISSGVPGFYADELRLDTVGGSFVLNNVPLAVLDVTNPNDPGNIIDGILGMHLFVGRDVVIDANPSIGGGGPAPSIYISDPVTDNRAWGTTAASADWVTAGSWSAAGVPTEMWDAVVANVRGSDQKALLSTASTVFRATVSGSPGAEMSVRIESGGKLTTFADLEINAGGRVHFDSGQLDAQYVSIEGGTLSGTGHIFVGSGPLTGVVRAANGGRIAPGDDTGDPIGVLDITGDLSNGPFATLAFDLGGTLAGTEYDQITVDRFAFLAGTLDVALVDSFVPQVGDQFTLITAGEEVQGRFETLALPSGFAWDVQYGVSDVTLQVTGIGLVGDFNHDGALDCADIDMLSTAAANGIVGGFDLTGDGVVDIADITTWVEDLKGTVMGDANLDGFVDTTDFNLWNSHRLTMNSNFCDGDFNGDGAIDATDFNLWNSHKFTSAEGAPVVPEPAAFWGLLVAAGWLMAAWRSGASTGSLARH